VMIIIYHRKRRVTIYCIDNINRALFQFRGTVQHYFIAINSDIIDISTLSFCVDYYSHVEKTQAQIG
jgi:hypothetical protein